MKQLFTCLTLSAFLVCNLFAQTYCGPEILAGENFISSNELPDPIDFDDPCISLESVKFDLDRDGTCDITSYYAHWITINYEFNQSLVTHGNVEMAIAPWTPDSCDDWFPTTIDCTFPPNAQIPFAVANGTNVIDESYNWSTIDPYIKLFFKNGTWQWASVKTYIGLESPTPIRKKLSNDDWFYGWIRFANISYVGSGGLSSAEFGGSVLWKEFFQFDCSVGSQPIKVKSQFDVDQDCLNPLIQIEDIYYEIRNSTDTLIIPANDLGVLIMNLPIDDYEIKPIVDNIEYFEDVNPYLLSITAANPDSVFIDFCFSPKEDFNDLSVSLFSEDPLIPGFESSFNLIFQNKGNRIVNGTVSLELPDTLLVVNGSTPNYNVYADGLLSWNFVDLLPFEQREININVTLNTPMDSEPLVGGEILDFIASINSSLVDEIPDNNIFQYSDIVVNSFDPNDIKCLQGNKILVQEEAPSSLSYQIRFENIGTTNAQNVKIHNLIDTSFFDLQSLKPIKSSHDFRYGIVGDEAQFFFRNIDLSFEDGMNDGYMVYSINLKSIDVPLNDIMNHAEIYFDFNEAIITNVSSVDILIDQDQDGYEEDVDCNDLDSAINPSVLEICDGIDNNCDGLIDQSSSQIFFYDNDSDGYGDPENCISADIQPSGTVSNNTDCDDTNPIVYPDAIEICDYIDNDCDGMIDEGLITNFYVDNDMDGYGDSDNEIISCIQPNGTVLNNLDCDDMNANVNPDIIEICDYIDNNCDGEIDEGVSMFTFYLDADMDGYGDSQNQLISCDFPQGYVLDDTDCNDNDANMYPGATEVCDNIDNDCDGEIDEDLTFNTYYRDNDMDGYGDPENEISNCDLPFGYVIDNLDCDDTDPDINPAAEEIPANGIDEDCDGEDGVSSTDELNGNQVRIFPNPTNGIINIEHQVLKSLGLELFNLRGQRLILKTGSSLDLSRMTTGLYLLKIQDNVSQEFLIKRIVLTN